MAFFLGDRDRLGFIFWLAAADGGARPPFLLPLRRTFPVLALLPLPPLRPSRDSIRTEDPLVAAAVVVVVGACSRRAGINGDTPCRPTGARALALRLGEDRLGGAGPGGLRAEGRLDADGGTTKASSDSTVRDLAQRRIGGGSSRFGA